jgi:hypothetical protein
MPRPPKYYTVSKDGRPQNRDFVKGKSNATVLETAFANSPQFDKLDRQYLIDLANGNIDPALGLVPRANQVGELKDFPHGVNFDYSGTDAVAPPDYAKVDLQIGGVHKSAITSPFTPNIVSSGNGVIPAETAPKPQDVLPMYDQKVKIVVNPAESSHVAGKQVKLGEKLKLGSSENKSRGTEIDG